MGKRLIIKGADFSENGMRLHNVVNLTFNSESTIPYKVYFLPTAITYSKDNQPTPPADAVENSLSADGDININGTYVSFLLGRINGDTSARHIKSLSIDYVTEITDARKMLEGVIADTIDIRGLNFGDTVQANCMFKGSSIVNLRIPDMRLENCVQMFYNFGASISIPSISFSFIQQLPENISQMFQALKTQTADFKGLNVDNVTTFNNAFAQTTLTDIDLSTWTFKSVTWLSETFSACPNLTTLHLDKFAPTTLPSNSATYGNMFYNTPSLTTVYVTNVSSTAKTWLLARLNENSAGGSSNWTESAVGGKAALVKGS